MTEGLFVLTTLFVAYVIYVIVNEKKAGNAASKSAATTQPEPVQQAIVVEEKPKAAAVKAKPAAKKAPAKPAVIEKTAEAPTSEPVAIKGAGLKDPKTGEVATTYSNYRFTKRWIKEALVAENLVEKVYKNDELNADVEAKIKAGIAKLEGMKKYKA